MPTPTTLKFIDMEANTEHSTDFTGNVLNYIDGMFYKCFFDKHWTRTYVSDGCELLTGYSREELLDELSLPLGGLLHPEDKKWSIDNCLLHFGNNTVHTHEYRIVTKKGEVKYVKNTAVGVYSHEGQLQYVEGFMQDNLMAVKERQFLKELNAYKRAINENIMVLEVDTHGRVNYANGRFCQVLQMEGRQLMGDDMEAMQPGIIKVLSKYYPARQRERRKTYRSVVAVKDHKGDRHWLDQVVVPVFEDHRVEKYLFLCMEITERVSADQIKNDYIKILEDMLFMVSHKVRQPVSHILGITHLIEEKLINVEELDKVSNFIKEAAIMLDNVTKEMSGFLAEHRQKHN